MFEDEEPSRIIAFGLAAGLGLAGLGYGLHWVIQGLAAAVGITTVIIGAGMTLSSYGSWIIPTATISLAIGGISVAFVTLGKAAENAQKNPYEWALPVIALLSGFVLDSCKELYLVGDEKNAGIIRVIYGASITASFFIGGILWNQNRAEVRSYISKLVASFFFLMPPLLVYSRYVQLKNLKFLDIYNSFFTNPSTITWALVIMLVMLLITALLSWIYNKEQPPARRAI